MTNEPQDDIKTVQSPSMKRPESEEKDVDDKTKALRLNIIQTIFINKPNISVIELISTADRIESYIGGK